MKNSKITLPSLNPDILAEFVFGDPEAKTDEVLTPCFQKIRGVEEFLRGKKSVVLGERGAGKSALFKLLANGDLTFAKDGKDKNYKTVIIPIDEDIEYLSISNIVEERFSDSSKRKHGKYRYLWEIYILSRIIDRLSADNSDDLEITTLRNDFGAILGLPKQPTFSLMELVNSYRLTVSSKFDVAGSVTPSMSLEHVKRAKDIPNPISDHEITLLRERIRKTLRTKNTIAVILVDRVDDFVVGTLYDEQLKNIQALVDCISDYRLPEMKLKLFLRTDLFQRMNFEHGGFDKIATQIIKLEWSRSDICEFVARRFLFNFSKLNMRIPYDIDLSLLDLDPSFTDQLRETFKNKGTGIDGYLTGLYEELVLSLKIRWAKFNRSSHTARQTDSMHAIIMRVITHILPHKVLHYNKRSQQEELSLENYLDTHFKLGAETPNPRLVLMFLIFTFEDAKYYYSRNPDRTEIPANGIGEYELILKENIIKGYKKLRETARKTVASLNPKYEKYIERLYSGIKEPSESYNLTQENLKSLTKWDLDDQEFHSFVKIFTHIGLLIPDDSTKDFDARTFSFPLVMKTCPF